MKLVCLSLILASLLSSPVFAQTAILRGQVTDESGAIVPGAKIVLNGPAGLSKTTSAANEGSYSFTDLPPGGYTVQASAPSLILRQPAKISLKAGPQTLNLLLNIAAEKQQVTVADNGAPVVSTDAANNASAIVISGTDLDALPIILTTSWRISRLSPDRPLGLTADPSSSTDSAAGSCRRRTPFAKFGSTRIRFRRSTTSWALAVSRFSPSRVPINFGAPWAYNFANDKWNSRNAYAAQKAPFHLNELSGTLSGPINKRASFNFNVIREWVDNGSVINGVTLDPQSLSAGPFTDVFLASMRRTSATPRVDYQLSANHTLTVRYSLNRDDVQNNGIGGLNLVSRGYHSDSRSQTVQVTGNSGVEHQRHQ